MTNCVLSRRVVVSFVRNYFEILSYSFNFSRTVLGLSGCRLFFCLAGDFLRAVPLAPSTAATTCMPPIAIAVWVSTHHCSFLTHHCSFLNSFLNAVPLALSTAATTFLCLAASAVWVSTQFWSSSHVVFTIGLLQSFPRKNDLLLLLFLFCI